MKQVKNLIRIAKKLISPKKTLKPKKRHGLGWNSPEARQLLLTEDRDIISAASDQSDPLNIKFLTTRIPFDWYKKQYDWING